MTRILMFILAMAVVFMAKADKFSYRFNSTPLPKAIQRVIDTHPELDVNFIYNELENYTTSATVNATNGYDAFRQLVGLNPVTVVKSNNTYYLEALQHGRYVFSGKVEGTDKVPVAGATVFLLAPRDSTVLTYGVTDAGGMFSIPCDRQKVIAKISCMGYQTTFHTCNVFNVGTIRMRERVVKLGAVTVEADNSHLYADRSVYIPTSRQKNASQTGADLLSHMAIPQLGIISQDNIVTTAGKPVATFIDYLPASEQDLQGMRTEDVKRVEYYEYPQDPRFQGNPYVINFIMQQYEYGGYVKAYGWETTFDAGQVSLYGKLQYKRMTFDVAAGAFYLNHGHVGGDSYETFRLPQADGSMKTFERNSIQESGVKHDRTYWPTLKALYSTDKITIQNVVGATFEHTPLNKEAGHIEYSPEVAGRTDYTTQAKDYVNSLSYNGYWNFILNDRNTITFSPAYYYTHTNTRSIYSSGNAGEDRWNDYFNAAKDDSHQFKGTLTYSHSFGKGGKLQGMFQTIITTNNTAYSGTDDMRDNAQTYRIGPGVQYSITAGKVYALAGFGYHWDSQKYLDHREISAAPWADLSLQYSPNDHHDVSGEFHHMISIPSSSYRSAAVIQSNPLMSYTGNPDLVSYKSYDVGVNYSFIPNNRFTFSAFGSTWIVRDRYVYDYQPTATGILRTIRQPGGAYSQWDYGLYGSVRLFDGSLQLAAQLKATSVHNGAPYNYNKTHFMYLCQAIYFFRKFNFRFIYQSPQGYPDGCMVGTWMKAKSFYRLQAGWSNSSWNVQLQLADFARWNWRGNQSVMHSRTMTVSSTTTRSTTTPLPVCQSPTPSATARK